MHTAQQRPNIIIFSSSQSLPIAKELEDNLREVCDCQTWDSCFLYGRSYLDSLLLLSLAYDACILVCGADDVTISKDASKPSPRDNVIFEIGLYMGRMGTERAMILAQTGVKLPSDLDGITIWNFSPQDQSDGTHLGSRCLNAMKSYINVLARTPQRARISAAVALNYFYNFLEPLVNYVRDREFSSPDELPCRCRRIRLQLPPNLTLNVHYYAERSLRGYKKMTLQTDKRKDFALHYKVLQEEGGIQEIEFCDLPYILRMCGTYLAQFFGECNESPLKMSAEAREIRNFKLVLAQKMKTLAVDEDFIVFSE